MTLTSNSGAPPRAWCCQKGFTLLEIIVVLILVSIGSALVYMQVGSGFQNQENRQFARHLVSLCREARRQALGFEKPVLVYIDSDTRTCGIVNGRKTLPIPKQMRIDAEGLEQGNGDSHFIGFFPDGSSSGGKLDLVVQGKVLIGLRIDVLTGHIDTVWKG